MSQGLRQRIRMPTIGVTGQPTAAELLNAFMDVEEQITSDSAIDADVWIYNSADDVGLPFAPTITPLVLDVLGYNGRVDIYAHGSGYITVQETGIYNATGHAVCRVGAPDSPQGIIEYGLARDVGAGFVRLPAANDFALNGTSVSRHGFNFFWVGQLNKGDKLAMYGMRLSGAIDLLIISHAEGCRLHVRRCSRRTT